MGGSRRLERPVPALLVLGRRAYVEIAARLAIRSCSGGGDVISQLVLLRGGRAIFPLWDTVLFRF